MSSLLFAHKVYNNFLRKITKSAGKLKYYHSTRYNNAIWGKLKLPMLVIRIHTT